MAYDFSSRERGFGRIALALSLDRKRLAERIVIGRADAARRRFEKPGGAVGAGGGLSGEVFYDETRPLGSLLLSLEADRDGDWNRYGLILRESYGKAFLLDAGRWRMAAPVSAWLKGKYESGEPSAMFAAARTWDEYLNCFNLDHGAELLSERLFTLYKPFALYADLRPWHDGAAAALSAAVRDGESGVELWHPVAKRPFECVAASDSLLPAIAYYQYRIAEWGYVFQQCKVCGKDFLARSRHYELCGEACRRAQASENKRGFDERAKGDRLEQLHESAYNYWYNRMRKLKKGDAANPERAAAVGEAFKAYRREAVRLKAAVKSGETPFSDFAAWLAEQRKAVDALMGGDVGEDLAGRKVTPS